jgi:hypothetical protein
MLRRSSLFKNVTSAWRMFASDGVFPLREPDDTRSTRPLEQATRNRTYARGPKSRQAAQLKWRPTLPHGRKSAVGFFDSIERPLAARIALQRTKCSALQNALSIPKAQDMKSFQDAVCSAF